MIVEMIDLWLDDDRDPNHPLIQDLFGASCGMVWVRSADAAINRLKSGVVRSISFDHDLGSGLTGYDVAMWIEERAFYGKLPRISWTVHSMNVRGAKAIRQAMCNADRYWTEQEEADAKAVPGTLDGVS